MPDIPDDRTLQRSQDVFVDGASMEWVPVRSIEGHAETGEVSFKQLLVGENLMIVEVRRRKGTVDPLHNHPDHESICAMISGSARVVIGGEEFVAGPGSAWLHPAGVDHYCEALEDCIQIEVKSPPRRTWDSDAA